MTLIQRPPRLGLALGSGSARGWAHIGVLQVLQERGIRPDVVCGASIGALVAAAYASGDLERLSEWVGGLGLRDVFGFMDFRLAGGMLKGEKLLAFWRAHFRDCAIEDAPLPYAAVATDLHSGAEVWLRSGSMAEAVRASIALPGLFSPVLHHDGRLLVDGGVVNPVPVSLARALGADIVIAVDLNSDILSRHMQPLAVEAGASAPDAPEGAPAEQSPATPDWKERLLSWWGQGDAPAAPPMPSVLDVVMTSVNIMQMRITRSRMAGDPPEVVIAPHLAHLGLLDFHRADEAIAEGRRAAERGLEQLARFLPPAPP